MDNKEHTAKNRQEDSNSLIETNELQVPSPANELEQLRHIVFGEAQNRLINQISLLRSDMETAINNQEKKFFEHLTQIKESTEQQFVELDNKLQVIDSIHDDNEGNLQKNIDNLSSEHDLFSETTQQSLKNLEQSIVNESATLSNNFDTQLEQLKSYLENVSKDLSSSKTDRKTLASLLATMATNLQDEQL